MKTKVIIHYLGKTKEKIFTNQNKLSEYVDSLALFKARLMSEDENTNKEFSYEILEMEK